jgi:hypothetical protein
MLMCSCQPEDVNDVPLDLPVQIQLLEGLEPAEPEPTFDRNALRAALIFRTSTATIVAVDIPVPADSSSFEMTLVDPHLPLDSYEPARTALFNSVGVRAFRPQLLIYEDRNQSASNDAADRLIGLDRANSVLFLINLENVLRATMTLPGAQSYYEVTGGRYTRFVRVEFLSEAGFYGIDHQTPIPIALIPSVFIEEERRCWHRGLRFAPNGVVSQSSAIILDAALARTSTAPELIQQCRTDGTTSAFFQGTITQECRDCACGQVFDFDIYLAPLSSLPPSWPCGQELSYCASSRPLQELEPGCES